ncbi:SGNH hydrolase-type esterase domain-containing protein [Xylariales sp. PMI_506]|nr:SGNH hydrolase-type esterase domain-containing protein [Xylariales sp. PMI_506]
MRVVVPGETRSRDHWVGTWAAAPQLVHEMDMPPPPYTTPDLAFHNTTIRQTLQVTTGGQHLRIRISNAFGQTRLHVWSVTIALPKPEPGQPFAGSKAVIADTVRPVTFDGQPTADIPNGALALSDPIEFPVQPGQDITVSIYLRDGQASGHISGHEGSRTGTWLCHGDFTADTEFDGPELQQVFHWYFLSGVEAWQDSRHSAFVLLGDSITDGNLSTNNGNDKWPDLLFGRMMNHPFARHISVINQAVGGNSILQDSPGLHALGRLDRDIFAQPGVRYVLVFDGVNDIGGAPDTAEGQRDVGDRLLLAYRQIASRVHCMGLPIFGATIGPMGPDHPYSTIEREATRERVNTWIRTSGVFDAVIDFDAVLRDPDQPLRMRPDFDSGDHLHPNAKAFQAMANAFPLELFEMFANFEKNFG